MQLKAFVLALASSSAVQAVSPRQSPLVIDTTSGRVQGAGSEYRAGVTVYKGIPFATPPTGANRWKPPQAPSSWSGVLNATTFGPQCAQSTNSAAGIFSTGSKVASEDCLTLNVWTPTYNDTSDLASKKLPVYVWIFGGRFSGGSADVKTYDGSGLATKDIIVVTLNYRLGAFGFLAHPDLSAESAHNSSGNYGILDHPLTKGLVHGVIAESGARGPHDPLTGSLATSYRTKEAAEAAGVSYIKGLNVSSIAELREVSSDVLIDAGMTSDTTFEGTQFENVTWAFQNPPLWRPVVDGYFLTHGYGEALSLSDHLHVPILTGNNKDESGASTTGDVTTSEYTEVYNQMFKNLSSEFLALYPADNDTQATNNSNAFFRDMSRVSTWTWASDWTAGGATSDVFVYFWTRTPAENPSAGAYHGAELWYTFNNIPYANYDNATWSAEDYEVEDTMSEYWANFIRTGNPNGDNLATFQPMTDESKQVMFLGNSWGAADLTDSTAKFDFVQKFFSTLKEY
ncbi:hypothetical protein AK830_g3765 [Neonectria ditissima]|uniref:Carboxylesterase type B domain-containing protein n=1 Tax=Neonectria ditissima TaxID=78410 RepID=A0A0P7BB03_9HYPO|nr:hypothetical protein AK830_g3765 [Neonectria ditissima]